MGRELIHLCLIAFYAYITISILFPIIGLYVKTLGASESLIGLISAAYAYSTFFSCFLLEHFQTDSERLGFSFLVKLHI